MQINDPTDRIARPRQIYTGDVGKTFEDRGTKTM
jgi:citrate synthase